MAEPRSAWWGLPIRSQAARELAWRVKFPWYGPPSLKSRTRVVNPAIPSVAPLSCIDVIAGLARHVALFTRPLRASSAAQILIQDLSGRPEATPADRTEPK